MENLSERDLRYMNRGKRALELERERLRRDIVSQRDQYAQEQRERQRIRNAALMSADLHLLTSSFADEHSARVKSPFENITSAERDEVNLKESSAPHERDAEMKVTEKTDVERSSSQLRRDSISFLSLEEINSSLNELQGGGGKSDEIRELTADRRLSPYEEQEKELEQRIERLRKIASTVKERNPIAEGERKNVEQRVEINSNSQTAISQRYTDIRDDKDGYEQAESLKVKSPQSKSDKDERAYRDFLERGKRLLNESKKEEEIAENVWMKEEAEDKERQIVEKLQRMELQDRLIDEENRVRAQEEAAIVDRMKYIKLRNDRVEEEKKKIQRLKALKQEEERLERRLQMRINEQIQQEDRFKLLLHEEANLRKELEMKEKDIHFALQEEAESKRIEERMQQATTLGLPPRVIKQELNTPPKQFAEAIELEKEVKEKEPSEAAESLHILPVSKAEELKRKEDLNPIQTSKADTVMQDSTSLPDPKAKELKRKEEYLKQLEKDLLKKEDEIRAKLNLDKLEETTTHTDASHITKTVTTKPQTTHLLKPYIGTFSGTDPIPKNESSYEEWKLEIDCLRKSNMYDEYIVGQSLRNSLKGQARKVLVTMGPSAKLEQIMEKFESVFGNVASGESVLQEFYTATQRPDESIALWGIRIEEIVQNAIEKGHVTPLQKNSMLKTKFWRSLYNTELKNATRVHFESIDSFELLRRKVRAEEYEMAINKIATEKSLKAEDKNQSSTSSTLKLTPSNKVEAQQQLVQQDQNTKLLKDLMKRLESLESKMSNTYQYRPRNRWNQGQWKSKKEGPNKDPVPKQPEPEKKQAPLNR